MLMAGIAVLGSFYGLSIIVILGAIPVCVLLSRLERRAWRR